MPSADIVSQALAGAAITLMQSHIEQRAGAAVGWTARVGAGALAGVPLARKLNRAAQMPYSHDDLQNRRGRPEGVSRGASSIRAALSRCVALQPTRKPGCALTRIGTSRRTPLWPNGRSFAASLPRSQSGRRQRANERKMRLNGARGLDGWWHNHANTPTECANSLVFDP